RDPRTGACDKQYNHLRAIGATVPPYEGYTLFVDFGDGIADTVPDNRPPSPSPPRFCEDRDTRRTRADPGHYWPGSNGSRAFAPLGRRPWACCLLPEGGRTPTRISLEEVRAENHIAPGRVGDHAP